jgi:Tol biopolymer transport system component
VVESITQITDDGEPKSVAFSDGSRIYFQEGEPGATHLAQVSVSGGRTAPVENAPMNSSIVNVALDGSEMLLRAENGDVLQLPLPAGDPRRLLDTKSVYGVDLLPDRSLLYSTPVQDGKSDLMIAERDGSNPRTIKSFSSAVAGIVASPDGQRLFLCERRKDGYAVQSMRKDGSDETFVMDTHDGDGTDWYAWSRDQKYIVYSRITGEQSDLWSLSLRAGLFRTAHHPIRLTTGPLFYDGAFPSPDGKRIFTVGIKARAEMVRYDVKGRQFVPYSPGLSAIEAQFSADGKWRVYVAFPDFSIWRSRLDGTERVQLTFPPMRATFPRFSPDGTKVTFTTADSVSYIVDSSGGQPKKIADPAVAMEWSPDGTNVAFTRGSENGLRICSMNLDTGKITDVPGSKGTLGAHFVDANTLVAFNNDSNKFVTFNFSSNKWSDLISLPSSAQSWQLSTDRKSLYYVIGGKELKVQRVGLANRKVETVAELKDFHQTHDLLIGGADFGALPDGSLIFSRDISSQEIYALNMRWP